MHESCVNRLGVASEPSCVHARDDARSSAAPARLPAHTCGRFGALLAGVLLLGGCALQGPPARSAATPAGGGRAGECALLLQRLDRAVASAGVTDVQAARIEGFPYLRANRFLATGLAPALTGAPFRVWTDRLRQLDRAGRRHEIANLPLSALPAGPAGAASTKAAAADCATVLRRADLEAPAVREHLREAVRVPVAYSVFKRLLGLYPLTSIAFQAGARGLHQRVRRDFATPLEALPVTGRLLLFRPAGEMPLLDAAGVVAILERSARNPLQIPTPSAADRRRLFAAFAPVWEVDVATAADRIGTPVWGTGPYADVDTARPAVFEHLSHTRFGDAVLLQLNYVVWFPARPRTGPLDILGGHLDGITWRVTLGADGRPLLYDAMHNCGCYHMFFTTPRVRLARHRRGWEEPVLVAQKVPDGPARTVLRIAHRTHYLQRIYHAVPPVRGVGYVARDYDDLRSLPVPDGGRRSLFGPDGIVAGTERRERWLYWPMGIPEPGAMRQWGHHATAFVGRRHFDDPQLIERYFERMTHE